MSTAQSIPVLWVSRHQPLPCQIEELRRKLGNVELHYIVGTVPNAEYVAEVAKTVGAKYVAPILPLSMISRLVELSRAYGFKVLWAEMTHVRTMSTEPRPSIDYNPDCETVILALCDNNSRCYKIVRFVKFDVIKAIRLEKEPL